MRFEFADLFQNPICFIVLLLWWKKTILCWKFHLKASRWCITLCLRFIKKFLILFYIYLLRHFKCTSLISSIRNNKKIGANPIEQGCPNYRTQAACGPPNIFLQPSCQIFIYFLGAIFVQLIKKTFKIDFSLASHTLSKTSKKWGPDILRP